MKLIFLIAVLGLAACSAGIPSKPVVALPSSEPCKNQAIKPVKISLLALLANPEKHEGQAVEVIGYYHHSFEHSAIYLHREDWSQNIAANGLWVDGSTGFNGLVDQYVRLQGIFTATRHGHLGQWPGELCNVGQAVLWGKNDPQQAIKATSQFWLEFPLAH